MNVTSVAVRNILGIIDCNVAIGPGITLICGPNEVGKTSFLDSIAYAMTGVKHRNLIPRKSTDVVVADPIADSSIVIYSGSESVAFVLDGKRGGKVDASAGTLIPGSFAQMPPKDRVALMLSASKVIVDPREALAAVMESASQHEYLKMDLDDLLRRATIDFDAAEDWARSEARRSKALWATITGQEWGSKKGGKWRPEVVGSQADMDALSGEIGRLRADKALREGEYRRLSEELGAARASASVQTSRPMADIDLEIKNTQAEIDRLKALQSEAGGATEPCPHCGGMVTRPATGGALQKATGGLSPQMHTDNSRWISEHSGRLAKLMQERGTAQAHLALSRDTRKVEEVDADIAACVTAGKTVSANIQAAEQKLKAIREGVVAERNALAAHTRILALTEAADALAPGGYRLRQCAAAAHMINSAMPSIKRHDGGKYECDESGNLRGIATSTNEWISLSWMAESAQWRANAAITMALCALSQGSVVLLDRFDVIEPACRMAVLDELADWSAARGVQIIMAATLKAAPELEGIQVHWMGR